MAEHLAVFATSHPTTYSNIQTSPEHLIHRAIGSFFPRLREGSDTFLTCHGKLGLLGLSLISPGTTGLSRPLHLPGAIGTTSQETASFSSQMGDPWGCRSSEHCLSRGGGETWKVLGVTAVHLVPRPRKWWGGWGAA